MQQSCLELVLHTLLLFAPSWRTIVAKRKDAPYRPGTRSSWVKVKTSEWRADNRWRGEFFEMEEAGHDSGAIATTA